MVWETVRQNTAAWHARSAELENRVAEYGCLARLFGVLDNRVAEYGRLGWLLDLCCKESLFTMLVYLRLPAPAGRVFGPALCNVPARGPPLPPRAPRAPLLPGAAYFVSLTLLFSSFVPPPSP